jgi:tRNA G18 (ribose-2'-O)-methylase SpoU
MASVVPVADPGDPRLADYMSLNDAELRRQAEAAGSDGPGLFIAEGLTAIGRLLASPYPVRSVLVTPSRLPRLAPLIDDLDVTAFVAEAAVLEAVAGFDLHRGAVAAADRLPPRDPVDVVGNAQTVVVLEGLNDHENLGAIARSARALGVDGLLLDPTCADPLYRRCVRVSMGEVLHLPFARLTPWPDGLRELRVAGWRILALTPAPDALPLQGLHVEPDERIAVLLGAEGPGLSDAAMASADERVRIALRPEVDSLNVGHAAAIAFAALGRA